jgi:tetraprenyl-beta-curcumene synthase
LVGSVTQPPVDFHEASRALETPVTSYSAAVEGHSGHRRARRRLALQYAFLRASLRYWLSVFPRVRRELARWRRRVAEIGDPALRSLALEALGKRGNIEGAAAFAAFVPRRRRAAAVQALTAFQAAYNYADTLAEQPSEDPVANGRRLHEALLAALDPHAEQRDYYEHNPHRDAGGYMDEMIERCRAALATLPSYAPVAPAARAAAQRIVECQSLSLGERARARVELSRWAREHAPVGETLAWWETVAAGGSSLGVYVLIALAADSATDPCEVAAIESTYFPWIGALHSLLDSLVDCAEDAEIGQLSLVGCYASPADAAARLGTIATQAARRAQELPGGEWHGALVAAMAGHYLSAPQASAPEAATIASNAGAAMGALAGPILVMFRVRHLAARLTRLTRRSRPRTRRPRARAGPAAVPEGQVAGGSFTSPMKKSSIW